MKKILVSAMLTSGIWAGSADFVHAASGDQVCEIKEVCIFEHNNLLGNAYTHSGNVYSLGGINYSGTSTTVGDKTSSARSRASAGWRVLVWEHGNGTGKVICLDPGEFTNSLPNATYGNLTNDSASAFNWGLAAC